MKNTEIKLSVTPEQLQRLNTEAAALGVHRAALVRDRALGRIEGVTAASMPALSPDAYRKAVEAAARTVSGVPRAYLEALVAVVIISLHETR